MMSGCRQLLRKPTMSKTQRHSDIVEHLEREPTLRVNELAKRFQVSAETIRRDLNELEGDGAISRTYGGAVRLISYEPALSERRHLMVPEREKIARAALETITAGDVLMIGGGITTNAFATVLAHFTEPVTVITPSFGVAIALGTNSKIKVQVLPGQFNGHEGLVQGPDTTRALAGFRGAKAFLSASGITAEGPADAAIPAGLIYQTMSERSIQTYIIADSSKFNKPALSSFCTWGPNMTLITDCEPPKELAEAIQSSGTEILVAPNFE